MQWRANIKRCVKCALKRRNQEQQNVKNAMRSGQHPLPNVRIEKKEHKNTKMKECNEELGTSTTRSAQRKEGTQE